MDRWDDIVAGVEALRLQSLPPLEVIIVVDQNPTLQERATETFREVKVVANVHRTGVSGARNTGLAHAQGEVIAFLDDDARPEQDWVEALVKPYVDPAVTAVGGVAHPVWPGDRPDQLLPELDWVVGCTYRGHPMVRSEVRNLFGCNMSVRRDAVARVGGFNEDIGRVGLTPLGCDDTEFFIRLRQLTPGSKVVFEPTAIVHHRVTPARTTWEYLRSRARAEGVSKAAIAKLVGREDATSVEGSYLTHVVPAAVWRELGRGLRGDSAAWRGIGGLLTCVWLTCWSYARTRYAVRRPTPATVVEGTGTAG